MDTSLKEQNIFRFFDHHIRDAGVDCVAVAFSGGGDSTALLHLLSRWSAQFLKTSFKIYALSVDHGLRDDSADEARMIGDYVAGFENVEHVILTHEWGDGLPESRVMEQARQLRYGLMRGFCGEHAIAHLYLGHHRDDQAETFLMRLAKGSGLDGLCGMRDAQPYCDGCVEERGDDYLSPLTLMRPLLFATHTELVSYCTQHQLQWVEDPTNQNIKYSRNKIRQAMPVLEEEGLSSKRLSYTAERFMRAKDALEFYADQEWREILHEHGQDYIIMDKSRLLALPEEMILRILFRCYTLLRPEREYRPRMQRLENLVERIMNESRFKAASLGGCVIRLTRDQVKITKEEG